MHWVAVYLDKVRIVNRLCHGRSAFEVRIFSSALSYFPSCYLTSVVGIQNVKMAGGGDIIWTISSKDFIKYIVEFKVSRYPFFQLTYNVIISANIKK